MTVGSSSTSTSPALTARPSCTWIARTTPVSNGWMTLVRPLGTILPVAEATMSTVPHQDQTSATQNSSAIVDRDRATDRRWRRLHDLERGRQEGELFAAPSCLRRNGTTRFGPLGRQGARLADFMDASLQTVQRRIAAAGLDQRVMGAVLDQAAALERDDAVRRPHGREPVRDDEDGSPLAISFMFCWMMRSLS